MSTRQTCLAIFLSLPFAFAASQAFADPWKDESGNGNYKREYERDGNKYEWRDGHCKYEYKSDKRGYHEEYKCEHDDYYAGGPPSRLAWRQGGPPPWAPAHGYRRKHGQGYRYYAAPYGIAAGRCNKEVLGAVLGGAAGGVIASEAVSGDGREVAIIGGTILGAVVGGGIGRNMDDVDQNCVGQALEHAPDGEEIVWNDPDRGSRYEVTPIESYRDRDGQYCREYQATAVIAGRNQQTYGRACRQPDGSWKIVGS